MAMSLQDAQVDIKDDPTLKKTRDPISSDTLHKVSVCLLAFIALILFIMFGMLAGVVAYMAPVMKATSSIAQMVPTSMPQTMTSILQFDIATVARHTESLATGIIDGIEAAPMEGASMGYTFAEIASQADMVRQVASTFKDWSAPGEATSDAWGGALTKAMGTDPLSWIQKQLNVGDLEALTRTCIAAEAQFETVNTKWATLATPAMYEYDEVKKQVVKASNTPTGTMFPPPMVAQMKTFASSTKQACLAAKTGLEASTP